jgi:hypothetical protein
VKDGSVKKNNRKRWISENKNNNRERWVSVKKTIVKDGPVKRKKKQS